MPRLYYDADGNAKKFCPRCKSTYDNPTENFTSNKNRFDGLNYYCKICEGLMHAGKNYGDPERKHAWQQKYDVKRKDDPERKKQRLEYSRSDISKEKRRANYAKKQGTPEYKATINRCAQKYRQTHPLKKRELSLRRIARKKQTTIGKVDYDAILQRDGYWCYVCQQDILSHQPLEFDHVIPLERNGTHTADNIRPTHRTCNRRKGKMLLEEMTSFLRRGIG